MLHDTVVTTISPAHSYGCCPFHDDKRPSLVVDERDDHFHCYGCRAHGDVISWVMRREGIGFTAACDLLSQEPAQVRPTKTVMPAANADRTRRWDRLTLAETRFYLLLAEKRVLLVELSG